jgi:hypothetical protein
MLSKDKTFSEDFSAETEFYKIDPWSNTSFELVSRAIVYRSAKCPRPSSGLSLNVCDASVHSSTVVFSGVIKMIWSQRFDKKILAKKCSYSCTKNIRHNWF